jgi:hypothetical protein
VSGLVSVVFFYKSSLKMAGKFSHCTVVKQRAVIRFLLSQGVKTSEIYRRMLAISNKRRGLLSKALLLLRDKPRPHSAAATIEAIRQLKCELLPHPRIVQT